MKVILLACACCISIQQIHAQVNAPARVYTPQQQQQFIDKYHSQKTLGWIFLGSGIALVIGGGIGYANYVSQGFNGPHPATAETLLLFVGPGTALAGIPFSLQPNATKPKVSWC